MCLIKFHFHTGSEKTHKMCLPIMSYFVEETFNFFLLLPSFLVTIFGSLDNSLNFK